MPPEEVSEWFEGVLAGLCTAFVWPAVLIAYALRGALFPVPRDVQAQIDKRRIAELERELDLHILEGSYP